MRVWLLVLGALSFQICWPRWSVFCKGENGGGWVEYYLREPKKASGSTVGLKDNRCVRGESGLTYTVFGSGVESFSVGRYRSLLYSRVPAFSCNSKAHVSSLHSID